MGTLDPDGKPPYDQNVKEKVMEFQRQGLVKFAWGPSPGRPEDASYFGEGKQKYDAAVIAKGPNAKQELSKLEVGGLLVVVVMH